MRTIQKLYKFKLDTDKNMGAMNTTIRVHLWDDIALWCGSFISHHLHRSFTF